MIHVNVGLVNCSNNVNIDAVAYCLLTNPIQRLCKRNYAMKLKIFTLIKTYKNFEPDVSYITICVDKTVARLPKFPRRVV